MRPRKYEVRFRLLPPHFGEEKVVVDATTPVAAMVLAALELDERGFRHLELASCAELTS